MADFEAYDRLIRFEGQEYRLQVKTRLSAMGGRYTFAVKHGNPRHASGVRPYPQDAFDLVALVLLDHNTVKFSASKAPRQSIHLAEIAALQRHPWRSLEAALWDMNSMYEELPLAA